MYVLDDVVVPVDVKAGCANNNVKYAFQTRLNSDVRTTTAARRARAVFAHPGGAIHMVHLAKLETC